MALEIFEDKARKKAVKSLKKAEFRAKIGLPLASYRYYLWRREKGVPEEEAVDQAITYFMNTFPAYSTMEPEELEEIARHFKDIGSIYMMFANILLDLAKEIKEKGLSKSVENAKI